MASLLEQVQSNISARRLLRPGQRVLLAVSGGVDSMVLLRVLHELSKPSGWKLIVAHLNHQLRGASSLADERLVRRTAQRLGLKIIVSGAEVRGFAKANGLSLEMAARKVRHDFLAQVALEHQVPTIALAHHLDDQVELFFLRLLRGGGSRGLAGMKWSNPSPSAADITLVRPLLNVPKGALSQYAVHQEIRFREDATNSSRDIQRNRIRHELLPLLERDYQAGVTRNVWRTMDILETEADFVHAVAALWLQGHPNSKAVSFKSEPSDYSLDMAAQTLLRPGFESAPFESLPVAIQRKCIQIELIRLGIKPDYDLIEYLRLHPQKLVEVPQAHLTTTASLQTARNQNPGQGIPGRAIIRVAREATGILSLSHAVSTPFLPDTCRLDLGEHQGRIDWEGVRLAWRVTQAKGAGRPAAKTQTEIFDADVVGSRVILRHWRPGDRFQPIGMESAIKLQDLFINQKIPRERRRSLAVAATASGDLFWVEGLRISERFKLTTSTIRRLHWAWQRL